jgi:phosphoribosylglycinamide formyltransferase-1
MPEVPQRDEGASVTPLFPGRTSASAPLALGVLVSGGGTNLQALLDACAAGTVNARVAVVLSDKPDAFGLERARRAGVPAVHVNPRAYADRVTYNEALREALVAHGVELVVMAGYMRLLGAAVLDAFPSRVVNLHPALLPAFVGAHAIAEAFDHGVKITGVTVHLADEEFDRGPIIAQEAVAVAENDTLETLETKIHAVEHRILPAAVAAIADGRVSLDGRIVRIDQG